MKKRLVNDRKFPKQQFSSFKFWKVKKEIAQGKEEKNAEIITVSDFY